MRLAPKKIDVLAELIFEALASNEQVELQEGRDRTVGLIRQIITDDLRMEEELEEEARRMLEAHSDEIQRSGASMEKLVLKTKQKLAQERKMVL